METKSRLRGPNFTSSDDLLLCDIINKYKNIIENKKTDGVNLLQKQKAWLEVMKEFNSITTGYSRTVETLQQHYKNLKKKAKKTASDSKMDIPGKRKLESEVPLKQSVSTKFSNLAAEKLELVTMQKEVVQYQLIEAKENLEHNRLLRAMEMEDAKKKYEHNELIRIREREKHK